MSYSKEQRIHIFAEEVTLHGANYSDAYRKSHPHCVERNWKKKTIHEKASKFAKTDKVQTMLQNASSTIKRQLKRKFDMTLNDTLCRLKDIADFDPAELFNKDGSMRDLKEVPIELRRAIKGLKTANMNKVDDSGQVVGNVTYISDYVQESKIQALNKILEYQLAEHDKPPEDDEKEEIDPIQLARRVISLIYAAKQKLDKDKQRDITHDCENQTSANDR